MADRNESVHHRRSIRLQEYDYSRAGAYFITICTHERENLLGRVAEDATRLSTEGETVRDVWNGLPRLFPSVDLDEFVVMPNHVHGIVSIVGADPRVCPQPNAGEHVGSPLPRIVQWFKTMTTNSYIKGVRESGWPSFSVRFWQRNYYEHVIRNEKSLNQIRTYIQMNPLLWEFDDNNPDRAEVNPDTIKTHLRGLRLTEDQIGFLANYRA